MEPKEQAERIRDLVDRCNGLERRIEIVDRGITMKRYEQGKLLREIREVLGHGAWMAWLECNCRGRLLWMAPSTARQVLKFVEELEQRGNKARILSMGYQEALVYLKIVKPYKEKSAPAAKPEPTPSDRDRARVITEQVVALADSPRSMSDTLETWVIDHRGFTGIPNPELSISDSICEWHAQIRLLRVMSTSTNPVTIQVVPLRPCRGMNPNKYSASCDMCPLRLREKEPAPSVPSPASVPAEDPLGFLDAETPVTSPTQTAEPTEVSFSPAERKQAIEALVKLQECTSIQASNALEKALGLSPRPATVQELITAAMKNC